MMLEQIIQITAIITFLASAIVFFIKIGEYKSLINNKIDVLENDVNECQNDIKELQHKIESLEANNSQFMSLLIEVKTKLELLISATGFFKNNGEK